VLTLVDGIAALRRATQELKASPPAADSGVIRFEVRRGKLMRGRCVLSFLNLADSVKSGAAFRLIARVQQWGHSP
jgi:hypothetical protein